MYLFILLLIYAYLLFVFKRKNLYSFSFIFGSVGFFLIVLFFFRDYCVTGMVKGTTFIMDKLGRITNTWLGYLEYGIIFVDNGVETISLNVDYECSGFIECLVYVSLCLFFPLYKIRKKILYSVLGIIYIEIANIIRLFFICVCISFYGNQSFYLAHSVLGRLIFFGLTLLLYFNIFTRAQIKNQKVGNFEYTKDKEENK